MEDSSGERLSNIEDSLKKIVQSQDAQLEFISLQKEEFKRESRSQYSISMMALGFAASALGAMTGNVVMLVFGTLFMFFGGSSIILYYVDRVQRRRKK